MKNSKRLIALSALFLCGGLVLGSGLTSCGPTEEDLSKKQLVVENEGDIDLSLPSHLVVNSVDSTYFSPYVVETDGSSVSPLSSGGDTLMTSGSTAALYAYHVPEGYTLSAKVDGDAVTLDANGTITANEVSEKTDAVITLFAESPEAILDTGTVDGDGNEVLAHRVLKKTVNVSVIPQSQLASNSVYQYASTLDVRERSEVTSQLERYALKNGLTGISLSDNGGYAVYNERVHSPLLDSDSYLPGYGFGTFMYGSLSEPLSGEQTADYQMYYHSQIDPSQEGGTINYLDSDLAAVNDLYSYMSASYWTTELNEDYTEQVPYQPNLARSAPTPLDMDEATGTAKTWRIPVWVGGETTDEEAGVMADLSFRTASSTYSSYDKRLITLEDYLTPFKLLATGSIGWYRGEEQAGEATANRQIRGFSNYYSATSKATDIDSDEEFSSQVGVSLDHETNSVIIEFNAGFTQEFAEYQLDSLWSNPMCEDFIRELGNGDIIKGAGIYGTSPSPLTPVDTSLSVGPYYLERYDSKQTIVFAKNEDWFKTTDAEGREIYQIEGYHIRCNSAIQSDSTALFTAWENNLVESATLIDEKWEQYQNDPRRRAVLGDNQQKWTFNRMDHWLWNQNFGEGGLWYEAFNPNGEETWTVKPISSNDNFFYGLNLGVDREGFAERFHRNPSIDYQNPIAKVNPATGELYNDSPEHAAAMEYVYGDAFNDLSLTTDYAVDFMQNGIIEELEAGHYSLGSGTNPTVVSLGLGSINDVYYRDRVAVIEQNWADEFQTAVTTYRDENGNNPLVDSNGNPRIVFDIEAEYVPSDVSQQELITTGMWTGKYDIQYAYLISGNAYDTINNMDILMSDKMGGFELNFATDTTLPSVDIYYDGKYWSFNSLWSACNGGTVVDDGGKEVSNIVEADTETATGVLNADGSASITFSVNELIPGFDWEVFCNVTDSNYGAYYIDNTQSYYDLATSFVDNGDGTYTITLPATAIFEGSAVGGPEGTSFVQFYFYYIVHGEGGVSAYQESVAGVLF